MACPCRPRSRWMWPRPTSASTSAAWSPVARARGQRLLVEGFGVVVGGLGCVGAGAGWSTGAGGVRAGRARWRGLAAASRLGSSPSNQLKRRRRVGQGRDGGAAGGTCGRRSRSYGYATSIATDGGVPVVVEQPIQRRARAVLDLVPGGGVGGVGAGQVVEAIPSRHGFPHKVGLVQLLEQPARVRQGGVEQRGRRVRVEVGTGMQTQ